MWQRRPARAGVPTCVPQGAGGRRLPLPPQVWEGPRGALLLSSWVPVLDQRTGPDFYLGQNSYPSLL